MKVIVITNFIAPVRTSFFNELSKFISKKGYEFKVLYTSHIESNRLSIDIGDEIKKIKYDYQVLCGKQLKLGKKDSYYFHFNVGFWKTLNDEQPDIIIHAGRASLSARISQIRCGYNKKKYILWNESSIFENSRRRTITKPIVKYLVKRSDGYLSFGTRASEYLEILGAKKEKICQIYNTVDVDYFIQEANRLKSEKEKLKQKYGIKTKNVLLFVGQLIERKGVYEILEGFKLFQKNNLDRSLVFVGGGQEKNKMEQIIKEQNIKNVYFPGFFQKDKISELYTIADVFTLPSKEEVRGLVINEAMCFGLPIITAYQVGASADLVQEGKNGYIMKENSGKEFEKAMNYIVDNGLMSKNNSDDMIKKFNVRKIIEGINL